MTRLFPVAILLTLFVARSAAADAAMSAVAQAPTLQAPTEQSGKDQQDAANSRLLAAAESFEVLTEQAFSATSSKLENLVNEVENAAQKVNALLSADIQSALDKQLSAIKQAQKANNPSELALAAVEGYRILVSLRQDTKIPTAVNLLDYAGFRYDANLKSRPTRWADMQSAVEFAREQWGSISGQVSQASLQKSFSSALMRMEQAVASKSSKAAASAVKDELDLVDKLEVYFSK